MWPTRRTGIIGLAQDEWRGEACATLTLSLRIYFVDILAFRVVISCEYDRTNFLQIIDAPMLLYRD
jgi:hypothetical protein